MTPNPPQPELRRSGTDSSSPNEPKVSAEAGTPDGKPQGTDKGNKGGGKDGGVPPPAARLGTALSAA